MEMLKQSQGLVQHQAELSTRMVCGKGAGCSQHYLAFCPTLVMSSWVKPQARATGVWLQCDGAPGVRGTVSAARFAHSYLIHAQEGYFLTCMVL